MDETKIEGISFDLTADHSNATASLDAVIKKLRSLKSLVANDAISNGLSSIGKALKNINKIGATDLNRITRLVTALSGLKGIGVPAGIADSIKAIADVAKGISGEDVSHIKALSDAVGGFSALQGVSASAIRAASRTQGGPLNSATQETLFGISEAAQDATGDMEAFIKAKEEAFREQFGMNGEQGAMLPALVNPELNINDDLLQRYQTLQAISNYDPFKQEKQSIPQVIDMYNQLEAARSKAKNYGTEFNIPLPDSIKNQRAVEFFREQMSLMPSLRDQWERLRDTEGMNEEEMRNWARSVADAVNQASADVQRQQEAEETLLRIRRQLTETYSRVPVTTTPTTTASGPNFASIFSGATQAATMTTMIFSKMANIIRTKVIPAAATLYKTVAGVMKTVGSGVFDYLTGSIRRATSAVSGLLHQFGRVALFRLLRTLVKDIGAAFTEGINNMYQWSLGVDRTFANAMDKIATASQYIKNSVAAMVSPFLESLAPVIDYIADKIVALFNLINQLFALLSGRGYWTRAIKNTKEYAKAAGSAAGSTGGLKKQLDLVLASFDELHLLAKESGSGGGGGGGGGAGGEDYGAMFENVAFDQTLKDLINSENWFGLGEYLAEKLNVITEAADRWIVDVFEPWAIKWATALGEIINGFVAKYNWELLGKTVADGMMAIVRAANAFLTTTDFLAIGRAFGDAVTSWFRNINWREVADFFANKLNAAIDLAKGFVLNTMGATDGTSFGQRVADIIAYWFSSVDWHGIAITLQRGVNWAIDAFAGFVNSEEMWNEVANALNELFSIVDKIDWHKLGESIGEAIKRLIEMIDWDAIGRTIGTVLEGMDWDGIIEHIRASLREALDGFFSTFGDDLIEIISKNLFGRSIKTGQKTDSIFPIEFGGPQGGGLGYAITQGLDLFKKNNDEGLEKIKASADAKTKEIRRITSENLTGGYGDASSNVPSKVFNFNAAANSSINTSGTLNIGEQTEEPINDNLLSGIESATRNTQGKINDFVASAHSGINTSGALDVGKETKLPLNENFMSGFKMAADSSANQTKILSTTFKNNIKAAGVDKVADDASKNIKDVLNNSFSYTQTISSTIANWIAKVTGALSGCLNNVNLGTPKANMPTYKPSTTPGGNVSFQKAYVTTMASGGPMDTGELYLAREAGAELIGRIGSQNAVVNNDQIVQAVSQGVAQAVAATLGSGGNNISVELIGDAKGLFRAVVKENNSTVARTGNSPLLI